MTYAVPVDAVGTTALILREELVSADARLPSENEYQELLLWHCVNVYSTEIVKKTL